MTQRRRRITQTLHKDPQFYQARTEPLLPSVLRRRPVLKPWSPFRRLIAMYSNSKSFAAPTWFRACGVQFPDGQIVLWHARDGYVDLHASAAAMRAHYLRYGDFSVQFLDSEEVQK